MSMFLNSLRLGLNLAPAVIEASIGNSYRNKYALRKESDSNKHELSRDPNSVQFHSLIMPPTMGLDEEDFSPDRIAKFWDGRDISEFDESQLFTVGETIALAMLSGSMVPLSDRNIVKDFSKMYLVPGLKADGTFCEPPYCKRGHSQLNIDWKEAILFFRKTAIDFADCTIAPIKRYNELTSSLSKISDGETRWYCTYMCERVFSGPVEILAMSSDLRNINYVWQKLKPANAIPLMFDLFNNPTWQGKICALVRLLELFEVDAVKFASELISDLAWFILKIAYWVLEKTGAGEVLSNYGVKWVAPTENEAEKQIATKYPKYSGCWKCQEEDVSVHCNWCSQKLCIEHMQYDCRCPRDYKHSVCSDDCQIRSDCFFDAIEPYHRNLRKYDIKKTIFNYINSQRGKEQVKALSEHYNWPDHLTINFEDNVMLQLRDDIPCGEEIIIVYALSHKRNIQVTKDNLVFHFETIAENEWTCIDNINNGTHYVYADNIEKVPTHYLWMEPYAGSTHSLGIFGGLSPSNSSHDTPATLTPPSPIIVPTRSIAVDPKMLIEELEIARASNQVTFDEPDKPVQAPQIDKFDEKARYAEMIAGIGPLENKFENKKSERSEKKFGFSDMFKQESSSAFDSLKGWFKDASSEVISWFDDNPLFSGIFAIIAGIASFFGLATNFPTSKEGMAGLIEKFNGATRTMHYAQSGFRGILEAFKDVMDEVRGYLGISKSPELDEFKEKLGDSLVKCKGMLFRAMTEPGFFVNNNENYLEFKNDYLAISQSYALLSKMHADKELAMLNPIWFALSRTYDQLTLLWAKIGNSAACRIEPTCAYFYGKTGGGKSSVLQKVPGSLNKRMNRQMKQYVVSKGNQHWNRFAQQKIIKFDDLNVQVTQAEGDIDSLHLFNLVSCAAFNPNQAALEDKNTMANPDFVLVASNHASLVRDSTIVEFEAWERRRHFLFEVTWPGHDENCDRATKDCEHWRAVKKKMEETGEMNFDHLVFVRKDPFVLHADTVVKGNGTARELNGTPKNYGYRTPNIPTKVNYTYDEVIEAMVVEYEQHKKVYEMQLAEDLKTGSAFSQTTVWQPGTSPVLALVGPPGTGKSVALSKFYEDNMQTAFYVNTPADLLKLIHDGEIRLRTKKILVIDDLTTFVENTTYLNYILDYIRYLYNNKEIGQQLVIGVNDEILRNAIGLELYAQVERRWIPIEAKFLKTSWTERFGRIRAKQEVKYYTKEDVAKDPKNIDKYVEYIYNGKSFLQAKLPEIMANFVPILDVVDSQAHLDVAENIDGTIVATVNMDEAELCKIVNSQTTLDLLKVLRNFKITATPTCKLSKENILNAIASMASNSKRTTGIEYDNLEDLFLQSRNSNHLEFAKGECCVLNMRDITYYIDYTGDTVRVGRLKNLYAELSDCVKSIDNTIKISNTIAIDAISSTLFPPWLLLSGEILCTIFGIFVTGASSVLSVAQMKEMHKAYSSMKNQQDKFENARETVVETSVNSALAKLGPMYPGTRNPKAAQYGDARDREEKFRPSVERTPSPSNDRQKKTYHNMRRSYGETTHERTPSPSNDRQKKTFHNMKQQWRESGIVLPQREYVDKTSSIGAIKAGPVKEKIELQSSDIKEIKAKLPEVLPQYEVATDPQLFSIVHLAIKNSAEVYSVNGTRLCSGLFIKDRLFRTVLHLTDTHKIDDLRIKTQDGKMWRVKMSKMETIIDRLDLIVTDPKCPSFKDITAHLPSKVNALSDGQAAVLVTPANQVLKTPMTILRSYRIKNVCEKYFDNMQGKYYAIDYRGHRLGFRLDGPIQTQAGDCGSVLILADPNVSYGKIVGMHFAGSQTVGYASPLYIEDYDSIQFQSVALPKMRIPKEYVEMSNSDDFVATVLKPIHIPAKTKIFRNWFPVGDKHYEPAVLCSKDPRSTTDSVLTNEAFRWLEPCEEYSTELKTELYECMLDIARHEIDVLKSKGVKLNKLTKTEALNKHKVFSHSEPINIATSAGFPWATMTKHSGKRGFITVLEDGSRRFNNADIKLKNKLNSAIDFLLDHKNPQSPFVAFQVFLKDEARPLAKIYDSTRTRTIAAAPLDFTIAHRMYFHSYHAAKMDNFHEFPCQAGIDATSIDWHIMYESMAAVSDLAVDLDFSGWDFSGNYFLLWLCMLKADIVYQALDPNYKKEDSAIRARLYFCLIFFMIVVGRKIYKTGGKGVPSGYPGTTPDNSDIGSICDYHSYKTDMKRANLLQFANFVTYLETCCHKQYGDDYYKAIDKFMLQFHNGITIAENFRRLGFKPTPASKEGEIVPYRPLRDCTFLSRRFVFSNGIWTGPLKTKNLLKPTWWVKDRRTHFFWVTPDETSRHIEAVVSSYESVLYEAAMVDRKLFDEVRECALKVYSITGLRMPPTWEDARGRMYGNLAPKKFVSGLTLIDVSNEIRGYTEFGIPAHKDIFSNRTSWSYGPAYSYNGSNCKPNKHTKLTKELLDRINAKLSTNFNSILVNKYPIGGCIPWHKDNEPGLDYNEGVFGVTMVGDGKIEFTDSCESHCVYLHPGLGYHMDAECLSTYSHRRVDHFHETISFTFRRIVEVSD